MTSYAADHASALADIKDAGAAITFTKRSAGTHDPITDTFSAPSLSSVAGHAIRTKGDAKRYESLKLTPTDAITLLFAPTTYGQRPALGATATWEGAPVVVRDTDPVAPDGSDIVCRVIVVAS